MRKQKYDPLRAVIKSRCEYIGMPTEELGFRLGLQRRTMQRRLQHPESFSVAELRRIENILHMEILKKAE